MLNSASPCMTGSGRGERLWGGTRYSQPFLCHDLVIQQLIADVRAHSQPRLRTSYGRDGFRLVLQVGVHAEDKWVFGHIKAKEDGRRQAASLAAAADVDAHVAHVFLLQLGHNSL